MRLKLPHISRLFSAALWILLLGFIGYNVLLATRPHVLGAQDPVESEKSHLTDLLTDYPHVRDAYLVMAYQSYAEHNLPQAMAYLIRAQMLDPNNATVEKLIQFLSTVKE